MVGTPYFRTRLDLEVRYPEVHVTAFQDVGWGELAVVVRDKHTERLVDRVLR